MTAIGFLQLRLTSVSSPMKKNEAAAFCHRDSCSQARVEVIQGLSRGRDALITMQQDHRLQQAREAEDPSLPRSWAACLSLPPARAPPATRRREDRPQSRQPGSPPARRHAALFVLLLSSIVVVPFDRSDCCPFCPISIPERARILSQSLSLSLSLSPRIKCHSPFLPSFRQEAPILPSTITSDGQNPQVRRFSGHCATDSRTNEGQYQLNNNLKLAKLEDFVSPDAPSWGMERCHLALLL